MKRKLASSVAALASAVAACSAPADSTTSADESLATAPCTVVADAYVASQYPTHTTGALDYLKVGTAAGGNVHRAYLKFSVSGVGSGASNVSAKLVVRATRASSSPIDAHCGSSNAWSESSLDWSDKPGFAPAVASSVASVAVGADATFDVSSCVTGNGDVTVVLDAPNGGVAELATRETATPPRLEVSYRTRKIIFGMFNNTSIAPAAEGNTAANYRAIADKFFVGDKMKVHRVFDSNLPSSYAASAGADDPAQGNVSFLSVKPPGGDHAGVASGKYDAQIAALAKTIPAGSYFTMYHEPEDNMTGPQFVAMFKRFYQVAKGANPNLTIGYVAMSYQWRPGMPSTANEDSWYPGDTSTDFLAVDAYDSGWQGAHALDTLQGFQRWYQWAQPKGKPILLSEFGVEDASTGGFDDATRAQVISQSIAWAATQPQIKMILYWDGTESTPGAQNHILNPTPSHPKDTYAQARAAWVSGIDTWGTKATTY